MVLAYGRIDEGLLTLGPEGRSLSLEGRTLVRKGSMILGYDLRFVRVQASPDPSSLRLIIIVAIAVVVCHQRASASVGSSECQNMVMTAI